MASLLERTRALLAGGKAQVPYAGADPWPTGHAGTNLANASAETHLQAYGGSDAIDHVMTATRKIMTTASQARYHFETDGGEVLVPERGPKTPSDARLAPPGLVSLLKRPNPWTLYPEMIQFLIIDLLLTGDHYLLKFAPTADGRPAAMYRMAPPYVQIVPGERTLIDHYAYQIPGMTEPAQYRPEDVLHFKLPNPLAPGAIHGMSVIAAAPKMYDIELSLVDTMRAFFGRGAKLSGVLASDRGVPEPNADKLRRQFARMYSGAHNAYQVAVLERGLKFQSIQPTAADAQFEGISKLTRDRIFAAFGVPLELVYRGEGTPNILEARRMFAEDTMRPLLDYVQSKFTEELAAKWGVKFAVDYTFTLPEDERLKLATTSATLPGITVGELREIAGLGRLGPEEKDEDGDPIDDMLLNLPGPTTEAPGGHPDRPLAGEAGRPPNPANTRKFRRVNGRAASPADVRRREAAEGNAKAMKGLAAQLDLLAADQVVSLALVERQSR